MVPEKYLWTKKKIEQQLHNCPQHLYVAFEGDVIVGTLSAISINKETAMKAADWEETSACGTLATNNETGGCMFGLDLSVDPAAQGKGIGDELIQTGFLFSVVLGNKDGVFLGSRVPAYHKWAAKGMDIEEYVVGKDGRTRDPEIRLYQKAGFKVVRIVPEYMEDPDSLNYGVLMFYKNPLRGILRFLPKPIMALFAKVAAIFI